MNSIIESDDVRLASGLAGRSLAIETANPKNFYEAIAEGPSLPTIPMIGRLFVPEGDGPFPVVIIVPGSLGLQDVHMEKAEHLTSAGIAACPIDPFHARSVVSTIANQVQYSFAASAWDVLATVAHLAGIDDVDAHRIGAQGHSRGGSAVLTAACEHFSAAVDAPKLRGVFAAYPWCGQQFLNPAIGDARVRAVIGDQDDWCLPQQVQGHIQAMRLTGGDATMKLFGRAHHSFDRPTPVEYYEDATVSPSAPTVYVADDGALIHPLSDCPEPALVDLDVFLYAVKAGYGRTGAHIAGGRSTRPSFKPTCLRSGERRCRCERGRLRREATPGHPLGGRPVCGLRVASIPACGHARAMLNSRWARHRGAVVVLALVLAGAGLSRQGRAAEPMTDAELVKRFHRLFVSENRLFKNKWFGVQTAQHPFDVWVTQEIIFEVRPDVIVETGTFRGGSAALWASILEHVAPDGRVISIDIEDLRTRAAKALPISKRKVDFLHGSSTAPDIVAEVTKRVDGKRALVILDSLHLKEHVLAELRAYAPLVPVGSYLIV